MFASITLNMKLLFVTLALVGTTWAQDCITCPDLGEFCQTGTFDGWAAPTCPGAAGLNLVMTMYSSDGLLGRPVDKNTVPSNFINTANTLFIAHGFNSNGAWMPDIKDALIENQGPANAITVSWGGSEGANAGYMTAASTTRSVGAELAEVMINLVTAGGGNPDLFQCTGHSLGAHLCGHFGRWAGNKGYLPGFVTGMDPAGPSFATNPDRRVGIYTDSAQFVQIIHTDRSLGSTPEPGGTEIVLGHQDFYPNDGNDQPGCGSSSCSHSRSRELFLSSISNDCFTATGVCAASNDVPNSCVPCIECPKMGYLASGPEPQGLYRLDTIGLGTYCPLE